MKYTLISESMHGPVKDIIRKYDILNNYPWAVEYPYPNATAERLVIEVDDLIRFYNDIKFPITISSDNLGYKLEICDYR